MSESIDRSNLATKDAIDGLITGQMNRQERLCSCGPPGSYTLTRPRNACRDVSRLDQHAQHDLRKRHPEAKSLLRCEPQGALR